MGGNYGSFASRRNRRHPFVDGITETPLPHKWKAPTVTYDETTDPDEFVSIYTNQISLYSTDDAMLCKSFSVALRGSALEWFMSLPPYTIDSFTTDGGVVRDRHMVFRAVDGIMPKTFKEISD